MATATRVALSGWIWFTTGLLKMIESMFTTISRNTSPPPLPTPIANTMHSSLALICALKSSSATHSPSTQPPPPQINKQTKTKPYEKLIKKKLLIVKNESKSKWQRQRQNNYVPYHKFKGSPRPVESKLYLRYSVTAVKEVNHIYLSSFGFHVERETVIFVYDSHELKNINSWTDRITHNPCHMWG